MKIYYLYILRSSKDGMLYTGFTNDLKRRIIEHNTGKSTSTKYRLPLKLIYFEGCFNKKDAMKREKYLKTSYGKRYIKNRLRNYFDENIA